MITIYKYPFQIGNETEIQISMPWNARILSCQLQFGIPTLWAMVDTDINPNSDRLIHVYATGQEIEISPTSLKFINTIQMNGYVFHIFEL